MVKTDSQQLAPRLQPPEPGTSASFVFFGATGDLAYKQIFPALQQMILRDNFNVPIIAVAKSGWTIEQLRARVRDSLTQNGGIDEKAYAKLLQLLQYIDGDYEDPKTFEKLNKALPDAGSPLHYLAIPPDLFGAVVQALGKSKHAENARVIVEKPFGRDLASARKLNATLHTVFSESAIFRIDHYLGKEPVEGPLAAATTTVSFGLGLPIRRSPVYAVKPGMHVHTRRRNLDQLASSILALAVSYVNVLPNHQRCLTAYKDWNVVGVESQQFTSSFHVHTCRRNIDNLAPLTAKPVGVSIVKHVNVLTNHQLVCIHTAPRCLSRQQYHRSVRPVE
jgi:hypothetical protein